MYNENPVEVALELEAHGIRRLCGRFDLDGGFHHVVNYRTLEQIAVRASLIIDFGVNKSDEDLVIALNSAQIIDRWQHCCVKNPELFPGVPFQMYGSENCLGADVKEHKIAVNGWKDEVAANCFRS